MDPVTLEDRKKELRVLLDQLQMRPSHAWTDEEQRRVVVLKEMIAGSHRRADA